MDKIAETARDLLAPFNLSPEIYDDLQRLIIAALRQARGDIAGDVCPHWTPGLAKLVSDAIWMARRNMSRRDFDVLGAVKDELDTLIQQAEAKEGG